MNSYQQGGGGAIMLYDEECTLAIDIEKAQGFLVLLQSQELAFMVLTDGNILDACFGAPPLRREGVQYSKTHDAKNALVAASETSDSIPALAIATYKKRIRAIL